MQQVWPTANIPECCGLFDLFCCSVLYHTFEILVVVLFASEHRQQTWEHPEFPAFVDLSGDAKLLIFCFDLFYLFHFVMWIQVKVLALQKFRSGLIFPSFFLTNQATTFGKKCTCSKTYHGTEYIGMISEMISLPPQMTTPPTSWKRSSYQTMKFSLLLPPLEYWTHPESLFLPFRV